MNRFDYRDSKPRSSRVAALAAAGLIGAVALAGCSAGQLAQTASQESAVDGNAAVINNVALRNVRILAQQNTDFLHPGATVDLVLVVVNQSPDVTDRLVGVTTDIGKVTVTGDPTLPAGGTLFVGTPNGQNRKAVERRRGRRRRQGDGSAEQADHQRPELQLHLQLREGRECQPAGADFGA